MIWYGPRLVKLIEDLSLSTFNPTITRLIGNKPKSGMTIERWLFRKHLSSEYCKITRKCIWRDWITSETCLNIQYCLVTPYIQRKYFNTVNSFWNQKSFLHVITVKADVEAGKWFWIVFRIFGDENGLTRANDIIQAEKIVSEG